jgi:N-hydroxyarylamine O-acetyltransferase
MINTNKFQSYFKKLDIQPKKLSLHLVSELQKRHVANFCFNNFAVLLGQPISLDISDIVKKIVVESAGGYCFEHNRLMHDVLESLGFKVRCSIARVINNQDIDSPRTHRVTILKWQNDDYLVDVGFGANCPISPVRIGDFNEADVNKQNFRIILNQHQDYQLEKLTKTDYYSLYTFNKNRYTEADCLVGNFYSYQHPDAVFVNNLVVSLIRPKTILSLINDVYHRIGKNGTEVINIKDHKVLQAIIKQDFNIELGEFECEIIFKKTCPPP